MITRHSGHYRYHFISFTIALFAIAMTFCSWSMIDLTSMDMSWAHAAPIVAEKETKVSVATPISNPVPDPIPSSYKLTIPYSSQAPYRQWGQDTYENGCEETSLMMVNDYWQKESLDADIATVNIKDMVDWQKTNWGAHKDITVWQLIDFTDGYYGPIYQNKVYNNPTEDELKKEIASGHPIIIAVMSHSLGNPGFGPNDAYHMLVLTGYDETSFIANDPGVNPGQGKDYRYTYAVLDRAMGAQVNHLPGQGKVALVIYPK